MGTEPVVIALRGTEEYARYLDRLLKAVQKGGTKISSRSELADHALVLLGLQHDLRSPRRVKPRGTNRFGEPKAR